MRWEVFKQDAPGKPHQAVGSVHGFDAEHALLNARHVFGRRPSAVSVWVVPADKVFSRTAEELAGFDDGSARAGGPAAEGGGQRLFHVFRKASHRRSMTFADHVLDVEAAGHDAALAGALARLEGEPAVAWWVVAADDVARSDPAEARSWFEPARDKTYKQQSAYGTVSPRRERAARP
ncbi:MAG TPA: phenylacetic acid degradation protein [Trueperaceae bacterium]|nr:phenylacetic acid degradation protein [Trueperaceae bacterium]